MLLVLLIICMSGLVVWGVVKWARVKRFWADRGVPHSAPHLLLGSLTFLQRENPALWLRKIYNEFKGPYAGVWLFWRPALIVNSPELARMILVKDSDNFRNRFLSSGKTDPIGSLNIFTANDPLWTSVRRRMTAVFTAAKLRSFQAMVREKADDLVERIGLEMKNPELFNLRVTCTDYSTDVIGESAFGLQSQSTKTGDSAVRKVTREFGEYSIHRGLAWSSIFFFPALVNIFRFTLFPTKSIEFMRRLFRAMVEERGGFDKEITENRDLLDALLKMRQEAAIEEEEMSEDLLLAQAAVFLLGGFETSGASLTWALYELAHQPPLQERLHEELVEAKKKNNTDVLDATQLAELPFLNAVLKETFRKFPPMGWMDRIAAHDYKIDENLTIPANTIVYVNAYGMHYDPDYFPQPELYNPERFLPENEKNIKPFTYLPFGEGPRTCIGMRFAYQTLRIGLSTMILKYTARPPSNAVRPNDIAIEKRGIFLMPAEKLSLIFTPRN